MPRPDSQRDPLPIARDVERALPDAQRQGTGRTKGNSQALKHGRYTAEAIAERRELTELLREMRGMVEQLDSKE